MAGELVINRDGTLASGGAGMTYMTPPQTGLADTATGQPYTAPSWVNDPANQIPQTPTYRYSDGSSAQSAADVQAANDTRAMYEQQIGTLNNQMGRLGEQESVGLNNILNSYNTGENRLNQQKAIARRNYETGVEGNNQSYLQTRGGIMGNVRANSNALQRLLGLNGSGNSSAAYEQAPYAAARLGTQNLEGAQQTYGGNARSLDMGWDDTTLQYKNSFADLNNQKYQQENSLRSSIAQTKAGLLDKIAQASGNMQLASGAGYAQAKAAMDPYTQQVNDLLNQITQLGNQYANPVLRTGEVSYKAPSLNQYSLGNGRIQQPGAANNIDETFAPIIAPQERDEYGNILG